MNFEIVKVKENLYSLSIEINNIPIKELKDSDIDGHILEEIISQYYSSNNLSITDIDFDSESDYLVAYSPLPDQLSKIKNLISDFCNNPQNLKSFIDKLEQQSPENLIDEMIYEEVDLSKPIYFEFFIDFSNQKSSDSFCREAVKLDLICYFDSVHSVYLLKKITPTKELLRDLYDKIAKLIISSNGNLDLFCYQDHESEIFSEMSEEWVLYNSEHL